MVTAITCGSKILLQNSSRCRRNHVDVYNCHKVVVYEVRLIILVHGKRILVLAFL